MTSSVTIAERAAEPIIQSWLDNIEALPLTLILFFAGSVRRSVRRGVPERAGAPRSHLRGTRDSSWTWFSSIGRLKTRLHDRLAQLGRGDGPIRPCVVLSVGQCK